MIWKSIRGLPLGLGGVDKPREKFDILLFSELTLYGAIYKLAALPLNMLNVPRLTLSVLETSCDARTKSVA